MIQKEHPFRTRTWATDFQDRPWEAAVEVIIAAYCPMRLAVSVEAGTCRDTCSQGAHYGATRVHKL